MKKAVLIGTLGIFTAVLMGSCVKVRTCTCIIDDSASDYKDGSVFTVTGTKGDARAICEGNDEKMGTITKTCRLQ